MAQRILTFNKQEQRASLRRLFRQIERAGGARVLDYGCGTGLFATTLAENQARYVGYDIDERLVKYASRLYASLMFTHEKEKVVSHGPYDYVVANCCFHHIPDGHAGVALDFIKSNLGPNGYFVMMDILAPGDNESTSMLYHVYGLIERGDSVRRHGDNVRLLEPQFEIVRTDVVRTHLFAISPSPLYTTLGIYVCRPRVGGPDMIAKETEHLTEIRSAVRSVE
jgi:SAM-dependent methyltransferase